MDYEKKYKEALELMKDCVPDENGLVHVRPCDIFTELAESEDERIRKELICFLDAEIPQCEARDKYIAWLEKQGEQKSVTDLKTWKYIADYVVTKWCGIGQYLDSPRLTTIAEELQRKYYLEQKQCEQKSANWLQELEDKLANATPQQLAEWKEKYFKEEPAEWSEEDTNWLFNAINICRLNNYNETADWLEALSDRFALQPQQEWSEEDEKMIQDIINDIAIAQEQVYCKSRCEEEINWLKSLRPQKQDVMSEDEFRYIVGYLVQDIVANEHMAETEKQPTKFFVEKYYKKLREG